MQILQKANKILKQIEKHHVNEYSIQCAYYVILSFIPFLILLFSLIQYTALGKDAIFFLIQNVIPGNMSEFIEGIIKEVSFKSIGTLSVSVIFLLWSAGRGFFALCKGFNYIYETPKEYNYWFLKLKSIICIIIFIIITVAVLFLIAFGRTITNFLQSRYMGLGIILKLRWIWQIFMLFLIFLLMYRFVPNHKVKFKTEIAGSIFAAVGWYILSCGFSIYLDVFRNFSVIYGSLTSIMLLMIWVYWSMYILLIGAEINAYMEKRKNN